MDTTILVDKHIKDGEQLLTYLFKYKWKINIAFWNKDEYSNEWKLYLGIPLKEEGSRSIYLRLTKRIMQIQPKLSIDIDDTVLIDSKDPVVKEVKRKLAADIFTEETIRTLFIKGSDKINGEAICYVIQKIKKAFN